MIAIQIVGLREGNHPFSAETDSSKIAGLSPEFFGVIRTNGVLKKLGSRYVVDGESVATARLVCDRSLEEYEETISASFSIVFEVDHVLAAQQKGREGELDDEETRGIREEDKVIDITEDVRQVLTVAIPFRRVAPTYRDKTLNEIHSSNWERDSEDVDLPNEVDDRWSALAKLKR
ncbi:MAG: DUF177 domain-containing protein [Candidatus Kapabacteria bacterium]|nr:DUF177 domain-containing protein [Candidatus Kapabacteria bacterium]